MKSVGGIINVLGDIPSNYGIQLRDSLGNIGLCTGVYNNINYTIRSCRIESGLMTQVVNVQCFPLGMPQMPVDNFAFTYAEPNFDVSDVSPASGAVGAALTISGRGFIVGVTTFHAVDVGSAHNMAFSISCTVDSQTQASCTVPIGFSEGATIDVFARDTRYTEIDAGYESMQQGAAFVFTASGSTSGSTTMPPSMP